MNNVLKNILDKKREKIASYKKKYSENELVNNIKNIKNISSFKEKIEKNNTNKKISIIAEIKKSSPSAGIIIQDFNPVDIAKVYLDNGATCLSVLTEEKFFLGDFDHIKKIKQNYDIPILCKDFFIDPYQVALAKNFGADCILIILSAVDKMLAKDLYQTANQLNLSTIVEVHAQNEAEFALSFEKALIGINNRNLKTLETSLNTSVKLSEILIHHKSPLISESGINSVKDINFLIEEAKIHNFLIGESLLKSENIASKLRKFTEITL